jgi:hypothetical protein
MTKCFTAVHNTYLILDIANVFPLVRVNLERFSVPFYVNCRYSNTSFQSMSHWRHSAVLLAPMAEIFF